jgi:hypothetical protein
MATKINVDEWQMIHEFLRSKTKEELGDVFKEYIEESCHGGWDGFSSRDVTGIRRMLMDLKIYDANR